MITKKNAYVLFAISAFLVAANLSFSFIISSQDRELAGYEYRIDELKSLSSPRHGGSLATAARIEKFKRALPEKGELTSILEEIFEAARRNDITVLSGAYDSAHREGGASRYVFTMPVEGRYSGLKRFLYELESSGRPLVVEEVTLSGSRAGKSGIGLNMKISVYYR